MCGLTLYSSEQNPIMILSGDKVTLTAKKRDQNNALPPFRACGLPRLKQCKLLGRVVWCIYKKMIFQKIYKTKFTKIKKYLKCIEKRKVL